MAQVVNLDALLTPNWTLNLPGSRYLGDDPEGHVHRDQIVLYLAKYAAGLAVPAAGHVLAPDSDARADQRLADKMCADPVSRSEVLAWAMRGRCPVEQGGIGKRTRSRARHGSSPRFHG